MWKRIVSLAAALPISLLGGLLFAQQAAPLASAASSSAGSLWTQTDWLRLEVCSGRIVVASSRCGQSRMTVEPKADGEARQTLAVEVRPDVLLASYELVDDRQRLTLEVDERKQLTICRQSLAGSQVADVAYVQTPGGGVTLVVGGDKPGKFAAAGLWQLLLAEPDAAGKHLIPVLLALRPNWQIREQLSRTELALHAQTAGDLPARRRAWLAWVDDLANDRFVRRQAADRALRSSGQEALGLLCQLDPQQLAPEQQRRIRGILEAAAESGPDTPERVAAWLADDKRVWLALMSRGKLDERIAAAQHLSQLCGRPLSLDPLASPDEQERLLVQWQALLAGN